MKPRIQAKKHWLAFSAALAARQNKAKCLRNIMGENQAVLMLYQSDDFLMLVLLKYRTQFKQFPDIWPACSSRSIGQS